MMLVNNARWTPKETEQGPSEGDLARLAKALHTYAPYDGGHELRLPGVYAVRMSRCNAAMSCSTST